MLAALERESGISSEEPDSYLRQQLHYACNAATGQEQLVDESSRCFLSCVDRLQHTLQTKGTA